MSDYREVRILTGPAAAAIAAEFDAADAAAEQARGRAEWEAIHAQVNCAFCGRPIAGEGLLEVVAGSEYLAEPLAPSVAREVVVRHRYGRCWATRPRVLEVRIPFVGGIDAATAAALLAGVLEGAPRVAVARQIEELGVPNWDAVIEGPEGRGSETS